MQQAQQTLDLIQGIPSAHDPARLFYPSMKNQRWTCDCEHFRIYRTPCRHILQKRFNNVKEIYDHICTTAKDNRDMRDADCQDFGEVITYVAIFREFEVNRLATLMLNIAVLKGEVSTDDLHEATGELYSNDTVVGVVTGALVRDGLLEQCNRKRTERKIAHGRSIGVYRLTEKGFKVLDARRSNDAKIII